MSRSTATPTAASSWTSAATRCRRAITALVAVRELAKDPGGTVIHNLITSHAVPEIVTEHGGKPVRTRVGHSFIKEEMANTGAIFGGEHSAHYYFRDFWKADTGMLAALHVLAALGEQDGPLSALTSRYTATPPPARSTRRSTTRPAGSPRSRRRSRPDGVTIDELDGLTVELADGAGSTCGLEHRAAAAPERRGRRRRGRRRAERRGPRDRAGPEEEANLAVKLEAQLLEILACPSQSTRR